MKFHRIVPAMVLFRIFGKNLIPSKTLVAMATKLKRIWHLALPNGSLSNFFKLYPGVKFDPHPGGSQVYMELYVETLEFSLYVAMRPRVTKFCM